MPELPDVVVYVERLRALLGGRRITGWTCTSPSLVKTHDPPARAMVGRVVEDASRIGKRIVLHLSDDLHAVLHLMIAGRLAWRPGAPRRPGRRDHAHLTFEHGSLAITEAATRKRAALHVVRGRAALSAFDRGGLHVASTPRDVLAARVRSERHTLKRALTDPRILDGIGGAYADEILHRARLSPLQQTTNLSDEEMERLLAATGDVLSEWTETLRRETGEGFPRKVTAFRRGMAVHGRYGEPCPRCGAPVQRIVYASRETNYCAPCQTGGRVLRDRALSRLLHDDWPRMLPGDA